MPSKRRKAVDSADERASKKRNLRSSSKPKHSTNEESTSARSQSSPASSSIPAKSKAKSKSSTSKNTGKSGKGAEHNDHDAPPNTPGSLSITHSTLKNPLSCQTYAAQAPPPSATHPTLIFTHGAGGTLSAPAVTTFCAGFSTHLPILAFQGNMNLPARVKGFHACIDHLGSGEETRVGGGKLVFGGRSMGARAAVIAASEYLAERDGQKSTRGEIGLILVSYPLQGPKGDLRDQILLNLSAGVEVLFVIGDKDAMCPLELLEKVREKMEAKSWLVTVRGANHGLAKATEAGVEAARWVNGTRSSENIEM